MGPSGALLSTGSEGNKEPESVRTLHIREAARPWHCKGGGGLGRKRRGREPLERDRGSGHLQLCSPRLGCDLFSVLWEAVYDQSDHCVV